MPDGGFDEAIASMRAVFFALDPLRFRNWAESRITTAQMRALVFVQNNPGISVAELAQRLNVTPASISALVDRLVRSGLVRREQDPDDRRRVQNYLTPDGEAERRRAVEAGDGFLRSVFARMSSADIDDFIRSHEAFVRAAEGERNDERDLIDRKSDDRATTIRS